MTAHPVNIGLFVVACVLVDMALLTAHQATQVVGIGMAIGGVFLGQLAALGLWLSRTPASWTLRIATALLALVMICRLLEAVTTLSWEMWTGVTIGYVAALWAVDQLLIRWAGWKSSGWKFTEPTTRSTHTVRDYLAWMTGLGLVLAVFRWTEFPWAHRYVVAVYIGCFTWAAILGRAAAHTQQPVLTGLTLVLALAFSTVPMNHPAIFLLATVVWVLMYALVTSFAFTAGGQPAAPWGPLAIFAVLFVAFLAGSLESETTTVFIPLVLLLTAVVWSAGCVGLFDAGTAQAAAPALQVVGEQPNGRRATKLASQEPALGAPSSGGPTHVGPLPIGPLPIGPGAAESERGPAREGSEVLPSDIQASEAQHDDDEDQAADHR